MNTLVQKLIPVRDRLARERGEPRLFGLFQREDAGNMWDLVIAAEWAVPDRKRALDYAVPLVKEALTRDEFLSLTAVLMLGPNDEFVRRAGSLHSGKGLTVLDSCLVNGMAMRKAYLLGPGASQPELAAAASGA
jgi:hypothetical protein